MRSHIPTEDSIEQLLNVLRKQCPRDYLISCFLRLSGQSYTDVSTLSIDSVRLTEYGIYVHWKGQVEIPKLTDNLWITDVFRDYLETWVPNDKNLLFASKHGGLIYRGHINRLYKRTCVTHLIDPLISINSMRWSYVAKLLLIDRCPIQHVKKMIPNLRIPTYLRKKHEEVYGKATNR